MVESGVKEPHPPQLDSGASGTSVSQSVPQPDRSAVLAKYKCYLQSCYNARSLAQADKYLPTLDAPYINLAIVSREYCAPEERDEFTKQTLHGGIDEILQSKKPISIEDLLSPKDDGRPVRFILVEGPPGIGKSTFAWEVCRRWDEIESLRDYHTVVLLKLRERWVLNAASLSDLFRYPFHPDFSNSIADELEELHGKRLLLVLDGFDEVSHSFHENSVIKSILCRKLLPECTIILTTRPVAKYTLRSVCQPQVDKHVEIIGFTEEERVRYITEVFSEEPELQVNFLKYMFLVPHIKSMMYIPLNCAIIAQVYYESQSSHHLAMPKTRTQLYKALTNSLLVRHMKMKESFSDCTPALSGENMEMFRVLAEFAFDSYHKSKKMQVTFFKEDIPEGLVHFGFMNESTEMYAGKGVERTFSFLHLSLQEYLAAWHLADSYSIEFQVAYHRLAVDSDRGYRDEVIIYKGDNKEEEALISSLEGQRSSLVEPAIFLAGITGWRCQSEDDKNHWEIYLSHDTACCRDQRVLLRSLYEAQNPNIVSHYFGAQGGDDRRKFTIGSFGINVGGFGMYIIIDVKFTPYECYAISYCVANDSNEFHLSINLGEDDDSSCLETLVKGFDDHCKCNTPRVKRLEVDLISDSSELSNSCLLWLTKARFLSEIKEIVFKSIIVNSELVQRFIESLPNLQSLVINIPSPSSWELLAAMNKSLNKLKVLRISSNKEYNPPPTDLHCWPVEHELEEIVLDIEFPSNTVYDLQTATDVFVDSVLKSVFQITKMVLPSVSRETMAGVHSILLHCPSLTTLELKRTRLGYDGILYICSALKNNTKLKCLVILDDLQLPPYQGEDIISKKIIPLPDKTTCTDFLLELNNILKDNTTLEEMKIQSGLFLPLSASKYKEYCQWTGLGPLQQFNVGAVGSGMSPNLRRSFSSSDLTQPQTTLFWGTNLISNCYISSDPMDVNFKEIFSRKSKLFSLPSFTAPDTEVLQSFSGLDPRLKECLEISDIHQYVKKLRSTYSNLIDRILDSIDYDREFCSSSSSSTNVTQKLK